MIPVKMCRKCKIKLNHYVPYKPEIGDMIVVINDHVSHGIPIGTIMEVKHLHGGFDGTCVIDYEVSPKLKDLPAGISMAITASDYVLINTPSWLEEG